ncbi:glutathione S-transferase [Novosphingobium sp.]|uniref:glutathione S-transferase n=1 Tax=Novosphingobium sp. TaxID=1874826 RepID=UPI00334198C1
MPTPPILYSFRRCPYAMRARMALLISGVRVELREVALSAKPAAMLAASPKGTVPVLVLPHGQVIDQSLDIMRWALAQHDPELWLARDDADLIAHNDGPFKHDLDRYKYADRHAGDAADHRGVCMAFLRELDQRLAITTHLGGTARGMTDMAIMPFVRQFAGVDPEWFALQPLPHLQAWLTGHAESPLFDAIMRRTRPWSPDDAQTDLLWPAGHDQAGVSTSSTISNA